MKRLLCFLLAMPALAMSQAPTSLSLKETGYNQKRDISIPGSRMVINPFNFKLDAKVVPAAYSNDAALPLNVGYLHTQFTNRDVENLMGIYHVKNESGSGEVTGWTANLASAAAWEAEPQASATAVAAGMQLAVASNASPTWKYMRTRLQTNIDENAVLKVNISGVTGMWSIKLRSYDGLEEKVLKPDNAASGSFEFNLQQLTGWSGFKDFYIQCFSIGAPSSVVVSDLRVVYKSNPVNVSWTGNMQDQTKWYNPDNGNGASWSFSPAGLTFNVSSSYHYVSTATQVTANITETPTLKIEIPSSTGLWSVKINDGSGDIVLRPDAAGNGVFYLNVQGATGWSGVKSFHIKVYSISYGAPASVTIKDMRLTNNLSVLTLWSGMGSGTSGWIKNNSQSIVQSVSAGLRFAIATANTTVSFRTASTITVDVDKNPLLLLNVPECAGPWALKINDGSGDIALQHDTRNAGSYAFDLRAITGWSGTKTFHLVFYVIPYAAHPSSVTVGDIRIERMSGNPVTNKALSYTTAWTPHDLPFSAVYADSATLTGYDYFYDKRSLVRNLQFGHITAANGKFILTGSYAGNISFTNNILRVAKEYYSYGLTSPAFNGKTVKYYATQAAMQTGSNSLAIPPSCGFWAIEIDANSLPGKQMSIATAFTANSDTAALPGLLATPLTGTNAITGHASRQAFWDNFFTTVPHPSRFDIQKVDPRGVTPQQVKDAYYKAFALTASNVLDAEPGVFNYPQVVTGKGSLWDEGAPVAPFSATWDSYTAIQQYAYVDPGVAWDAFKGLMSLTDAQGVIAGESLPSRKAQTAWILFQLTGDTASLTSVYEPMKRYFNWRLKYPYWVYNTVPDTAKKDAEFVFSALVDLAYMRDISKIVFNADTAAAWEQKRVQFYETSKPWFWQTPGAKPVQYYDTQTGVRSAGNTSWVTTGLYVDLLSGSYLTGMNNLFHDNFSSGYNFYLHGVAKYPDLSYTIYGLIARGRKDSAEIMVDAAIRQAVLANTFSEAYSSHGASYPEGVRPSLFGASQVIDFVWLKNGFSYDRGFPHVVGLFGGNRGISNLKLGGRTLEIAASGNNFSFSGTFLEEPTTLTLDTMLIEPVPLEMPALKQKKSGTRKSFVTGLRLFPNPITDYLNIAFAMPKAGSVLLRIHDQLGRQVGYKVERLPEGKQQLTFDMRQCVPGVYICSLYSRYGKETLKCVKQ